jgi:hypothetical protein
VRSRRRRSPGPCADGPHADATAANRRLARRLAPLWALYITALVGGFVVAENPTLVPTAQAAAQQAADRLHSIFAGARPPTDDPTAPPPPVLPPPQARAEASSTSQPPIAVVLPTAAAVPATVTRVTWSGADCAWAGGTLARDVQLDVDEATAVQSGRDTRYGTGAPLVSYYRNYAAEWSAVSLEVSGICQTHTAPTQAQVSQALGWFTQAEQAHAADTAGHPEDADWNNAWIGNYLRLVGLFSRLPH